LRKYPEVIEKGIVDEDIPDIGWFFERNNISADECKGIMERKNQSD